MFPEERQGSPTTPALVITAFDTGTGSVRATVRVVPPGLRVSPQLATEVLALRPTLAQHACKQRGFGLFADKIIGTTLPHLVEHLAIDLLVERMQGGGSDGSDSGTGHSAGAGGGGGADGGENASCIPQAIAGTTTWLDHQQGIMQVRVSCTADAADAAEATRAAISDAVALLNALIKQQYGIFE